MREKLKKIISFAVDNGFYKDQPKGFTKKEYIDLYGGKTINEAITNYILEEILGPEGCGFSNFLFSHNFAKKVFGVRDMWKATDCTCGGVDFHLGGFDMHYPTCLRVKAKRGFKFHLKEAVVSPNPINYYYKFVINLEKSKSKKLIKINTLGL